LIRKKTSDTLVNAVVVCVTAAGAHRRGPTGEEIGDEVKDIGNRDHAVAVLRPPAQLSDGRSWVALLLAETGSVVALVTGGRYSTANRWFLDSRAHSE